MWTIQLKQRNYSCVRLNPLSLRDVLDENSINTILVIRKIPESFDGERTHSPRGAHNSNKVCYTRHHEHHAGAAVMAASIHSVSLPTSPLLLLLQQHNSTMCYSHKEVLVHTQVRTFCDPTYSNKEHKHVVFYSKCALGVSYTRVYLE